MDEAVSEKDAFTDLDFEKVASEIEDRRSSPPSYEIATYPADFTLEVLYNKLESGEIEIPDFQRKSVWNIAQASKLIESFLLGLPVPAIFLYTNHGEENSMVVDGQQRLRSVYYFFQGYFGEPDQHDKRTVFRLKGLNERSKYLNKSFADLEADDPAAVRRLKNSVLRAFVIRQLDPDDDTSVIHIFERLNTGGTFLHNQEVRNAVYGGSFNALLHDLNSSQEWREILGKTQPDSRMRDVELILRFFALRYARANYAKPMKDHLSKYMFTHASSSPDAIESFRKDFTETTHAVRESLGKKPFHVTSGFNSSAFDSVYCAFSTHRESIPSDAKERWTTLKKNPDFKHAITGGTTDVDQVHERIDLAGKYLFEA